MTAKIIEGGKHIDNRGKLFYNNDFDASQVKRVYVIENESSEIIRRWQGHQVEQRWFSAINGSFKIHLIKIDDWNNPTINLEQIVFIIDATKLNILHIPAGYVSSIQSLELNSKLLVMADYNLGEINDEYKYNFDFFI